MRLTGGGYTIIEVMIFLAVSSLLFVAATVAIGGQQGHTEFNTAVNDVNTKFQQWIDQVTNGFSGSTATATASQFNCSIVEGYPVLTPAAIGGNTRGANPDCIFLGKAIQINQAGSSQDPRKIYAYTVLGKRTTNTTTNDLVADIVNAAPAAAVSTDGAPTDLVETYTIPNGAQVKWVRSGPDASHLTNPGSHLAGFYNSFNSGGSSTSQNGSQSLLALQYPFTFNVDARATAVSDCIRMTPTTCPPLGPPTNPFPMNQWVVCLQSTRNSDTAAINIVSTNGHGATTKVTAPCPVP